MIIYRWLVLRPGCTIENDPPQPIYRPYTHFVPILVYTSYIFCTAILYVTYEDIFFVKKCYPKVIIYSYLPTTTLITYQYCYSYAVCMYG